MDSTISNIAGVSLVTNSLAIIALVMLTILVVPLICRKIRIPSIVGFILVGTLVGPYGLNLLAGIDAIQSLGKSACCISCCRRVLKWI